MGKSHRGVADKSEGGLKPDWSHLAKPAVVRPQNRAKSPETARPATNAPGFVWLPYPPSGNRYWRHVGARVVVSREAREYRAKVAKMLASMEPIDGDVGVEILVHRPARRGDLDNTLKVLLDAVRGFAYHDDSQIVFIQAQRFDGIGEPGVRLVVKPAAGFSIERAT